jgi:carboxyl-terminal processing protease
MRLKVKSIIISFVCALLFAQNAFAIQFVDVVERSLFYDAINYFTTEVPILATDRAEFNPLDKVTKAEFFKLLIRSGGYDPAADNADLPYYDVTGTEWYSPYIKQAMDLNIIQFNDADPNFNAGNTVTRAEAIDWILKFYGINPDSVSTLPIDYNDVSPLDSFANISKIAYQLRLLHDYKSGLFNANKELTRAEAVHIFYKVHQNDIEITFPINANTSNNLINVNDANFALFYEVWNKVTNEYINIDEIDKNELIYGAISGLVYKLDDPYSVFFEPIQADSYLESLEGEFDGIGIYLNQEGSDFVILTPLKGSPAEDAGIKPNDIIIEIDDVLVRGLEIGDVIELLRGAIGTEVKLKLNRDGKFIFKYVTRAKINIPFVESEMRDNIGIISYYQFTNNSNAQFTEALDNIIKNNPKGIILDLRNNPGGYIYSAQQLISRFIPANEPYIMADGSSFAEKSLGPGDLKDIPLIVLINEGSASASEIAALALKDQINAKILGVNSYGKAKIQEILTYPDGSTLKLSVAKWTSPNGTYIQDVGITPDYLVESGQATVDDQLDKALQLIKN